MMTYIDRVDAGKVLADHLKDYTMDEDAIVLALPRGGVPVAYEVAKALSLPLDVFLVRKIGMPGHEELAIGAIAAGGVSYFNQDLIDQFHIPQESIDKVVQAETKELQRRQAVYRGSKPFPELMGKKIILMDDGIATGATIKAAIQAVKQANPAKIIVAVPVASQSSYAEISSLVDECICPLRPENFSAVGEWYQVFGQTSDEEVIQLLKN